MADDTAEIKKLMETDKLIVGAERTVKILKLGKIEKVFLTSNCSTRTRQQVEKYSELAGAIIVPLEMNNIELGALCKKPFFISALGVLKGK